MIRSFRARHRRRAVLAPRVKCRIPPQGGFSMIVVGKDRFPSGHRPAPVLGTTQRVRSPEVRAARAKVMGRTDLASTRPLSRASSRTKHR